MHVRNDVVSTRTFSRWAVVFAFLLGSVGAAFAATSGIAPLLVPYTITTIAGEPNYPQGSNALSAGYFGEGVPGTSYLNSLGQKVTGATLNGPYVMAVDSVGNVYITDRGNNIIREVNAQSGLITTVAGVTPKGCSGIVCALRTSGCADGVPAAGNPIGSGLQGIAVDSYGNVFFVDSTTATISVVYRGGAQVAAFIALEDPAGVATSGGAAQVGYVYHVAGTVDLGSCKGTVGNTDNALAFQNTTMNGPSLLSLDGAGNIYVADIRNLTVRVINTQATPQTFFQYVVQPGYMRSITNCSALLTVPCPAGPTTGTAYTGINGPVNALVYNSQYKAAQVDAYGNIYQLNGTGGGTGPPGIYSATTFAGGAPLTNLLQATAPYLTSSYGPNGVVTDPAKGAAPAELDSKGNPTYGNSYITIGNPAGSGPLPGAYPDVIAVTPGALDIRPSALSADVFGTLWFLDNHYPELERIDQYTGLTTNVVGSASQRATLNVPGIYLSPASLSPASPWQCVYGVSGNAWTQGPITYNPEGDGCPGAVARISGNYNQISDGLGNIFLSDGGEQLMRELPLGNAFPPTTVGTSSPVTQAIQVHFHSSNPPLIGGAVAAGPVMNGVTTTSFSIAPGISDFTINTTTPEFAMGSLISPTAAGLNGYALNGTSKNFAMWAGLPTCTQLGLSPTATSVIDYDCLVYVTFNPTAPGMRQSQLVATSSTGNKFSFSLSGVGVGPQLAIDGGTPTKVPATGLGQTAGVAVTSSGTLYIADPANNRIVVAPAGGTQTAIGPAMTGVTPATLSGPMGVAVDSNNNVYISDTGNNRILKVTANTGVASVLGNNLWISCPIGTAPGAVCPSTVPQYQFKAPQGLAVDAFNNVYVADTGNAVVVEIPSNIALGGAVPLLAYPNAPKFVNPVAIAIDAQNNVYVADTKTTTGQIVKLPPGGGDLVAIGTSQFPATVGDSLQSPSGVAVDAAGNVYVSDLGRNDVKEFPSASGDKAASFELNFPGITAPAGLALDASGNLYVADSGNKQVLFDNRQNPMVDFGTVPQFPNPTPSVTLHVSNIGSQAATLIDPFTKINSTNPAGSRDFSIANNSCTPSPGGLTQGTACTLSATFNPTINGGQGQNVSINGTSQTIQLTANGEAPLASIVLSAAYSGGAATSGGTATITATVTQPHVTGDIPSGTVTFTYAIDAAAPSYACGTGGTQTVTLSNGTASFALPTLAQGLTYTINASYTSSDPQTSGASANPLDVKVPGIQETVIASPVTFTYGQTPPAITGTVTPTPASPTTYTFTSAAKATTPVGTYPIQVLFTGGNYCAYGFPAAVTSSGSPALVTETAAPLSYKIPNFTTAYGALPLSYGANAVITGAVNGDTFSATFTNADSSLLNVGTYTVTPTVTGASKGNYTVTAPASQLTVTQAPSGITVSSTKTQVANTAAGVASAPISLVVGTLVTPQGKGNTSGSILIADVFSPITAGAPGTLPPAGAIVGAVVAKGVATLTQQAATSTFTPTAFKVGQQVAIVGLNTASFLNGLQTITAVGGSASAPTFSVATTHADLAQTQDAGAAVIPIGPLPLTAGFLTYTPTDPTAGTHAYSFFYSGDTNFQCSAVGVSNGGSCPSTGTAATILVVDNPDFSLSSTTGVVNIIPGVAPSGNGLPPAANQSTAAPETAVISINAVLGFVGQVAVSCTTQNPSYVTCSMTPPIACLGPCLQSDGTTKTITSTASVLAVSTPATLPLGFFNKADVRTSASKTVLAFLPFGVLAFCVRRRKRLSKALWMLIGVAAIGAGMQGCGGGNQVSFYTPVPTGLQSVTVTATFTGSSSIPAQTRTFVVPININ